MVKRILKDPNEYASAHKMAKTNKTIRARTRTITPRKTIKTKIKQRTMGKRSEAKIKVKTGMN